MQVAGATALSRIASSHRFAFASYKTSHLKSLPSGIPPQPNFPEPGLQLENSISKWFELQGTGQDRNVKQAARSQPRRDAGIFVE
jgi:hypothetical protein